MSKWTESMRIDAAINRAARRGRITRQQARSCMHAWPALLIARKAEVKRHCWAVSLLNEAAARRRAGDKGGSRYMRLAANMAINVGFKA